MRVALTLCVLSAVLVVGNAATVGKAAERKELTATLRKLRADLKALESKDGSEDNDQNVDGSPENDGDGDDGSPENDGDGDDGSPGNDGDGDDGSPGNDGDGDGGSPGDDGDGDGGSPGNDGDGDDGSPENDGDDDDDDVGGDTRRSDDGDDDGSNGIALKAVESLSYIFGDIVTTLSKLQCEISGYTGPSGANSAADDAQQGTRRKRDVEPLRRRAARAMFGRLAHPAKGGRDDDSDSPDRRLEELIDLARDTIIALDVLGS